MTALICDGIAVPFAWNPRFSKLVDVYNGTFP
jgi:hypothetical protein